MCVCDSKREAQTRIYFVSGAMRKTEGLSHNPKGVK